MKYKKFYHNVKLNNKSFKTGGISVLDDFGNTVKTYYDVSTDFTSLEDLVYNLNKGNVEIEQIDDILDDFYLNHY